MNQDQLRENIKEAILTVNQSTVMVYKIEGYSGKEVKLRKALNFLMDLSAEHLEGKWLNRYDDVLTKAYLNGMEDGENKAKEELEKRMEGLPEFILGQADPSSARDDSTPIIFGVKKINDLASAIRQYLKEGR